jgi:DNA-directed RNA polymerase I, II, and III subunit RPABC2
MSDLEESDIEPEVEQEPDLDETDEDVKLTTTAPASKKLIDVVNSDEEDDDLDDEQSLGELEEQEPELEEASLQYIDPIGDSKYDDISQISPVNSDVESEDEEYYKKFESSDTDYIKNFHPESLTGNSTEIEALTKIVRNANNVIIDENHKTNPFLSKYERTKILGQRTKQLNSGAKPFVSVPPNIIDNYLIAQMELTDKKIPVIIRRPLPNGKSEYWKLQDLELI